jgi:hypothetical protein
MAGSGRWVEVEDASAEMISAFRRSGRARLFADENIEEDAVRHLRHQRINVVTVRELGQSGKPDEDIAAYAFREKRFLLTKNGKHFLRDRDLPFHRVHGLIVVQGDMRDTWQYARSLFWITTL